MPRPSSSPAGTLTAATAAATASSVLSTGVNIHPLTPSTPASVAATGTSTSTVTAAVIEYRRMRCSSSAPSSATGRVHSSAIGPTWRSSSSTAPHSPGLIARS